MAKLVYMPTSADKDHTEVAGITFPAYEAVEIPDVLGEIITKLKKNPWFALEEAVDEARKAAWEKVRHAHAKAAEHRAAAEQLEREGQ